MVQNRFHAFEEGVWFFFTQNNEYFEIHYHFPYFTHTPQGSCVERSSTVIAQRLQAHERSY